MGGADHSNPQVVKVEGRMQSFLVIEAPSHSTTTGMGLSSLPLLLPYHSINIASHLICFLTHERIRIDT